MTIRLAVPAYFHPERDARTWARLAGRAPAVGLVDEFDFAVDESCVQYRECAALQPFTAQGKPVLHVEYDLSTAEFCPGHRAAGVPPDPQAGGVDGPGRAVPGFVIAVIGAGAAPVRFPHRQR